MVLRDVDELSGLVVDECIRIHRELGPGLLESAYRACLLREFELRALEAKAEVPIRLAYKGRTVDCGFRADVIVEGSIILELKTVESLLPIHEAQLLTYLKLDKKSLGLLINFNVPALKKGVKRVACGDLFKQETGGQP